jgi:hypothetical protein
VSCIAHCDGLRPIDPGVGRPTEITIERQLSPFDPSRPSIPSDSPMTAVYLLFNSLLLYIVNRRIEGLTGRYHWFRAGYPWAVGCRIGWITDGSKRAEHGQR